jgi:thioredoxin 1
MDIDQNPETPSRYGVRGIPTLMLFQGGTLVATRVGGDLTVSQLQAWVDQSLAR